MSWTLFQDAVARCEAMVAAAAPDAPSAAEGRAYVARLAASSLSGALLGHLLRDDGLSRPLPVNGGPNPDYRMHFAPVDPARAYRLEGSLNESDRIGIGLYCYGEGGAPLERGYRVLDSDSVGKDGKFAFPVGQGAGSAGLAIPPDARLLLVRVLHRDAEAQPARLRLIGGGDGAALGEGDADAALAYVAGAIERTVKLYLLWTEMASQHRNRLAPAPPHLAEAAQGDPGTHYFIGGFDLAEGEWLELAMSGPRARYWSIHAYSHWFEHLRTPGIDDRNARADAEGAIRIAIGPSLPIEASNIIDTAGRRRGALICRIVGQGECPTARVRSDA